MVIMSDGGNQSAGPAAKARTGRRIRAVSLINEDCSRFAAGVRGWGLGLGYSPTRRVLPFFSPRTSRTFSERAAGVKGFWRKAMVEPKIPLLTTAPSVYPDM